MSGKQIGTDESLANPFPVGRHKQNLDPQLGKHRGPSKFLKAHLSILPGARWSVRFANAEALGSPRNCLESGDVIQTDHELGSDAVRHPKNLIFEVSLFDFLKNWMGSFRHSLALGIVRNPGGMLHVKLFTAILKTLRCLCWPMIRLPFKRHASSREALKDLWLDIFKSFSRSSRCEKRMRIRIHRDTDRGHRPKGMDMSDIHLP